MTPSSEHYALLKHIQLRINNSLSHAHAIQIMKDEVTKYEELMDYNAEM